MMDLDGEATEAIIVPDIHSEVKQGMAIDWRKRLFPGLVLFLAAAIADAQVYKWKDRDGRDVFGDTPPQDAPAEKMRLPDLPVSKDAPNAPASWQDEEYMFKQRQIDREKAEAKVAKAEEEKKRVCASLRDRQKYLQAIQGRRVVRWNSDKGEYEYLTDNDRTAMQNRVREALDQSACGFGGAGD
jgi:hypothetical protein